MNHVIMMATVALACAPGLLGQGDGASQDCRSDEVVSGHNGEALDDYFTRLSAFGFSGSVLVAEGDRMLLHKGYGLADAGSGEPVTTATAHAIASLTKQFTAAGIMRLVTLGRLSTGDSLGRFVADIPVDKQGITIHHLLSHTSGLPWDVVRQTDGLERPEIVRRTLEARLRSAPGERYGYSNAGYHLLALVIEEVTGRGYTDWIREELFARAGLNHTGFTQDRPNRFPCRATPRDLWRTADGWWEWPRGWWHGAGEIVSTTGDLFRWHQTLARGDLLSDESRASLFRPHVPAGDDRSYGYGWYVGSSRGGKPLVYHGGDNRGYHSEFRWFPDGDRVIVILTSLSLYDESGNALGLHKRVLANAVERILDGETVAMPPAPAARAVDLAHYAGTYQLATGGRYTIWLDGDALKIGADGQDAVDALLGADAALKDAAAAANARAAAVLPAIVARDRDQLQRQLTENERWIIPYWLGDAERWTEEHGAFRSLEVLGSRPLPWQVGLLRTVATLRFGEYAFDFQFTWDDGSLYESLTDLGAPHVVIHPLAPVAGGGFATWDLVAARGAEVRFAPRDGGGMSLLVQTEAGEVGATRR